MSKHRKTKRRDFGAMALLVPLVFLLCLPVTAVVVLGVLAAAVVF